MEMKNIWGGRVVEVRPFESENKSGPKKGQMVSRVSVTIECRSSKGEDYKSAKDELCCVSFLTSEGQRCYDELSSLEEGMHVKIRSNNGVTMNEAGYINCNVDAMWVADDKETDLMYRLPTITMRAATKATKVSL